MVYPWKFSEKKKKDYYDKKNEYIDLNYLKTYLKLLKEAGINILERKNELHYIFPWMQFDYLKGVYDSL